MEQSALLMSAKIHFVDAKLSLVHISLDKYERHIPTILKLLFPPPADGAKEGCNGNDSSYGQGDESWANKHAFLNVSVTPIECSIVCETHVAEKLFETPFKQAQASDSSNTDYGSISTEDFVVISVEGAGMEAGQRVLELTSPLALAGM
jgi:hypothetical protein